MVVSLSIILYLKQSNIFIGLSPSVHTLDQIKVIDRFRGSLF